MTDTLKQARAEQETATLAALGETIPHIGSASRLFRVLKVYRGPYGLTLVGQGDGEQDYVSGEPILYDGAVVLAAVNGYPDPGTAHYEAARRVGAAADR